ncbi:MAG: monovalent cation/H(+) antiporter subunit G [Pseudomonadota bacterium]
MIATLVDIVAGVLVLLGAVFAFVAALGVVRLPDVYVRMHAATKAGTLAAALTLIAVALVAFELSVTVRVIAAVLFLLLTAPVSSHLLARAAYLTRVRLWKNSVRDDLFGKYDMEDKSLKS